MKLFALGAALLITIFATGCANTNNYYSEPKEENAECGACQGTAMNSMQPAMNTMQPVMMPMATQVVTSYEEVYATEYTANGPVVKKQLIPIKSTVPVVAQPVLMQTPNGYPVQPVMPVVQSPATQPVPVIIGTPPAQPVVPAIEEPVAWFGPTAAPNYSTQTNWF